MKFIKVLILIFIIIIAILSLLLFNNFNDIEQKDNTNRPINILNTSNKNNTIINTNQTYYIEQPEYNDFGIEINLKDTLYYVDEKIDYFTMSALFNNYINLVVTENIKLRDILSPSYIADYNITDENMFDIINIQSTSGSSLVSKTVILDMLGVQMDNITYVFIVKGKCRISEKTYDVQVMFEVNTALKRYNAYPAQYIKDKGIDKLKIGDKLENYNKEEIKDRYNNNSFKYITKSEVDTSIAYFEDYIELINYYPEEAYNKLDKAYAEKRFGSFEAFNKYLEEYKEKFLEIKIDKYKVETTTEYKDYICADQYANLYIFRQQDGIMRYSAYLDNYTILLEEYEKNYIKADKFDKAKYNLTKFMNMVNTGDYNAIYNVLDKTFRANNYKIVDSLKEVIKNNLYTFNLLEIDDYDDETYEYYIFDCIITNMKNTKENKKMTIIINQSETADFTMSFSFV